MRENEASIRGRVVRDLIAHTTNDLLIGKKIKNGELRKQIGTAEPPWKCPECFTMQTIEMEHFTMELLESKENANRDKIILQLHGGGYVGAMRNAYRMFAGLYNEVSHGMSVLTPDYRVAPEHPYPAALEDAVAAYLWLIEEKKYAPEKIIIAGDSAGGGLTLALTLYLRDHSIPMPAGIIVMSPWADLTCSGESYDTNYELDPLFGNSRESMLYNSSYIGNADPKNPYLSPVFGDFKGLPPMLFQTGGYEMMLSDTLACAELAKKAGIKRRVSVYEGMFHVFQMSMGLFPESREAWAEAGQFIQLIYQIRRKPDGTVVKRVKNKNWK